MSSHSHAEWQRAYSNVDPDCKRANARASRLRKLRERANASIDATLAKAQQVLAQLDDLDRRLAKLETAHGLRRGA